ncbi:hypothetical protein ACE7GA_23005 [Roseomonas sp. CCTCC AB2023176]|uniref:hypothetical protein n=1 Tax=Roseomonas sp. CCTCC AB2023176 TaxID=3342640 RepID=UPI0035E0E061
MPTDTHAPPPDLDFPAARSAASTYRAALSRGVPEAQAWDEATTLFALHHPAWPLPLAEREAARTVGALIALSRALPARPTVTPPLPLLRRLAAPEIPTPEIPAPDPTPAPPPPRLRTPPAETRLVPPRPLSPHLLARPPFLPPIPPVAFRGAAPC